MSSTNDGTKRGDLVRECYSGAAACLSERTYVVQAVLGPNEIWFAGFTYTCKSWVRVRPPA